MPDSSKSERLSDIGAITAMVMGLYLTSLYGYLLFHSLVEITTIAIGFTLFILTWNTRRFLANNFLSILGIGYTFIALIDLLHTLAYKGMHVFPGFDANLPTQLWIAARYLQAVTLCAAPFFMERRVNNRAIIGAYAAIVSVLVTMVYSGNFPDCYVEGKGLTTFKIGSEYLITVLILTSLYLLYRERKHFNDRVFFLIVSSIVCTAVSEISFTAYASVYGFANMVGHFSKLAAFYLIYRAILVTGLKEPFDLIFRELKQAQEALRKDQDILEEKIKERTAELQLANERLQQELAERERAQEALRRYAKEIQDLYDHAPCGYHSLDSDGTIIRINDTELQWLGYRRDEVLGKMRFSDLISGSSLQTFREHFPIFMEKGWHRDLEYEMVRRDGTTLPVLLSATALYDEDGNYLMSRSTIYDITERRKAEEKERLMSAIVQSSDDAIVSVDLDGVIISWNRGAERIYGYSAEEALGKSVSMLIPPDHLDELAEIITHLRRGEGVKHYVTEQLRKDGQRISISLTVSPILNGAGDVVGASSIARDITGQVHAEEALSKSERDLKEAQRIAQIGSWDWDATTDTIAWSAEYYRIYNVDPNAPVPNYLEHLKMYTDESAKRLAAEVAKTMQTGQPYELELELANPDTSRRWSFVRGEAKYDADGEIVGLRGTAQNITQRKLAEMEILKLNADLEQRVLERTNELEKTYHELKEETAQRLLALEDLHEKERMLLQQSRLAALGEMISNIAHQWRQPLNELGLIVQELPMMYEKGNFDGDYLKASVAKFMKLLSHTSRTIDDFRNFFKPDQDKVPFKVREAVEKTLSLVEESFRQLRITITVKAAGEPVITGHPNEFSQVILNILFNARDAFLARRDDRPRRIDIEISSQGGRGVVTVADNAGGIPEEIMEKIFDPYFTTRGPEQGTGIGLYMSKIIIEKNMPGRLSVRNTAEGAEFRIEV